MAVVVPFWVNARDDAARMIATTVVEVSFLPNMMVMFPPTYMSNEMFQNRQAQNFSLYAGQGSIWLHLSSLARPFNRIVGYRNLGGIPLVLPPQHLKDWRLYWE